MTAREANEDEGRKWKQEEMKHTRRNQHEDTQRSSGKPESGSRWDDESSRNRSGAADLPMSIHGRAKKKAVLVVVAGGGRR